MRFATTLIAAAAVLVSASAAIAQDAPSDDARMAAFKKHDKNTDGKLDKAEYLAVVTELGFAEMADTLFDQRDANKDGFVSEAEYKPSIG